MVNRYVIITAAGSGKRMGTDIPKQFLPIDGKPILMRTIEAFHSVPNKILVLSGRDIEYWNQLCERYDFKVPCKVVEGGEERFHSVKNALEFVPDDAIVAIHDGVRPFVSDVVIEEAFKVAEEKGSAVPVIDCVDSVRIIAEDGSNAPINRNLVKLVQTPQVFRASILKKAYNVDYSPAFTDDASVVECAGYSITLTKGNVENKKITVKNDLNLN
ncbi:MAG: 2-C-methyl-D-erythritol 4-phosphate cytidylyltransferase [Paludibacteraceae bacterium]|nr:2-C-methyl-D-erythritol 4-phosphate cytidylyltransferase [Paludibacteraceae bacterium]